MVGSKALSETAVLICESTNENSDRSENHLTKEPAVNSPVALRQLKEKKRKEKKNHLRCRR